MIALPVRPSISLQEILIYAFIAFIIGVVCTPMFVRFLHRHKLGKQLRVTAVDGSSASVFLKHHAHKAGTPTMGGLLIVLAILATMGISRVISFFGVVDHSILQRGQAYIPLAMFIAFGIVGAIDDLLNIRGTGKNKGLSAVQKLLLLSIATGVAAYWFYFRLKYQSVYIPFGQSFGLLNNQLDIGYWYIPFFMLIVIGTANAVNVTDGLDGLAAGLLIIAFGAFGITAYIEGLYVLAAFSAVVAGAVAAFLWNNVPPAIFFMGDVGALALGGTLAIMALMIGKVLLLPLIGFIFLLEILSVILQLSSKKLLKRKIFKSAPFHHHLQALGWSESKVTMRLWIIGAFVAFLGVLVGIYG